jgi:endonuclease YncB( thermonuclease family)
MSYVAKVEGNKVKIYKSNGSLVKTISPGGPVKSAIISGDEIQITMQNGKIRIYGMNGSLKKII